MRISRIISLIIALLFIGLALKHNKLYANFEKTKTIKEVLLLKFPQRMQRKIIRPDPVEYELVNDKWTAPNEGDLVLFAEKDSSKWQKILANDDGWF